MWEEGWELNKEKKKRRRRKMLNMKKQWRKK